QYVVAIGRRTGRKWAGVARVRWRQHPRADEFAHVVPGQQPAGVVLSVPTGPRADDGPPPGDAAARRVLRVPAQSRSGDRQRGGDLLQQRAQLHVSITALKISHATTSASTIRMASMNGPTRTGFRDLRATCLRSFFLLSARSQRWASYSL